VTAQEEPPAELVGGVARAIAAAQSPGGEALPGDWVAARAAIAAVREWDLVRGPYATRADDGTVTLTWPRGRAEYVWASAELIESFADRVEGGS
jgi:hypothetical protein